MAEKEKLVIKKFNSVKRMKPEMVKQARNCTYRNLGTMSEMLTEARSCRTSIITAKAVVVLEKGTDYFVGWGMLFNNFDGSESIQLYVKQKWRRKGIGTKIVNALTRMSKSYGKRKRTVTVYPDNYTGSVYFFRKIRNDTIHFHDWEDD